MSDFSTIFVHSHCVSRTQLLAYVRGKLDREENYLIESHINDCQFCNDAVDAFMEADLVQVEADLTDAKVGISQNLQPVIEELKVNGSESNNVKSINSGKNLYRRLMAAASLLLLIGLGGYSVFSYIQSHKKELALNEKGTGTSSYDAEYSKPEDEKGEIVRLNVKENDTFRRYADADRATKPFEEYSKEKTSATSGTAITASKSEVDNVKALEAADYNAPAMPAAKATEDKVAVKEQAAENDKIEAAPGMENYARNNRDEKMPSEASKVVSKKKSAGGLKDDNNARSNQMNYPRGNNNDFNQQRNVESVASTPQQSSEEAEEVEETLFERGKEQFNKKNYRRSISLFEKALKKAGGSEREEIMYFLAQAYENAGKTEKANDLYATLSKSKKYGKQADKKLKEAQIKEVKKK